MAKNAVDQCDFSIKMRFSEKILFPGKQAILALKIAHPHNFGSAVGFFWNFAQWKAPLKNSCMEDMRILGQEMARPHNSG